MEPPFEDQLQYRPNGRIIQGRTPPSKASRWVPFFLTKKLKFARTQRNAKAYPLLFLRPGCFKTVQIMKYPHRKEP
jgi:hypothetical protein